MASVLETFWEWSDWDQDLQDKLRARHEAGKKLSIAEHTWVLFDKTDRGWDQATTRRAWLKVVKEHKDKGDGAGRLIKKRRSTRKKMKKKPSKKYRSRRRKHTKRR